MAARKSKKSKSPQENSLIARAYAVEQAVKSNAAEIITGIEHQIRTRDEEGESQIIYPLPNDFTRDAGVDSEAMRIVVWGKVLQHFQGLGDEFTMRIVEQVDDPAQKSLMLSWPRSIEAETVKYYDDLIRTFMK